MKNLKKSSIVFLTFIFILFLFPIGSNNVQAANPKINKSKLTLYVPDKFQLNVENTNKKVKWSSSNKKIASINSKGEVTARKSGKVTVTAKVGKKKYKCIVTVKKRDDITFSCDELVLTKGNSFRQLMQNKNVFFFNGIKWSSSNKCIASVDKSGKIKAKKAGNVTITAKYKNKNYKFKLKVVNPIVFFDDERIKVSLECLYSYPLSGLIGQDLIQLKVQNKTNKAFTFVSTNISFDGNKVASNRLESTKISANSESYNYSFILDKPVVISKVKTISGSMYIIDNYNNIINNIDFQI